MTLVGLTAPFWHIFYGISDTEGPFGYAFMSSFLNSLGTRLCILCIGLLLHYFSKHIVNEYRVAAKFIGSMTIYVGCYFLILIVFPKKLLLQTFGIRDFHRSFYYASMIILSVSSGFVFTLLQRAFIGVENKIKQLLNSTFKFIIQTVPEKYIPDEKLLDYQKEYEGLIEKSEV